MPRHRTKGWPPTGFGAKLRTLREAASLSQNQLAIQIGVGSSTINKLEAGHHEPQWPLVLALAKALGVEITAFLLTEEPKKRKGKT